MQLQDGKYKANEIWKGMGTLQLPDIEIGKLGAIQLLEVIQIVVVIMKPCSSFGREKVGGSPSAP